MKDGMKKPEACNEKPCRCILNIQDTFCIGKSHVTNFYVGKRWHRNDHRFCLMSQVQGLQQYLINTDDIDLLARLFLTARSETRKVFNLTWYFNKSVDAKLHEGLLRIGE